jgi:hypothetical protein
MFDSIRVGEVELIIAVILLINYTRYHTCIRIPLSGRETH